MASDSGVMGPGTPATLALNAADIAFTAHTYVHDPSVTHFGHEAATALGLDADRVFKTLVADADGQLVIGIVPVTAKLDLKALASALGAKKATMADPARAQRKTGYVLGGISPIGQRSTLPTLLDETAAHFSTIFVSGGRRGFDIELAPRQLLYITQGQLADIARWAEPR